MKRRHRKTLELIFRKPVSGNVKWQNVVAMLNAYDAIIDENRAGSRVHIELRDKDLLQRDPIRHLAWIREQWWPYENSWSFAILSRSGGNYANNDKLEWLHCHN